VKIIFLKHIPDCLGCDKVGYGVVDEVGGLNIGFCTGTVWVELGDTVPVPVDTVPMQVLHSHCTHIVRVTGYTCGSR
jgi:hypothetical protein